MTPEEKARIKIDQWFADAGWKVVNREDYEPTCTAVAIREGLLKGNLEADYFLFINGKAVGVLEAKREETDAFASKVCEQAALYARSVPNIYQAYQKPLPFIFTSNGKELYCCDFREQDSCFKQIMNIPTPHELVKRLGKEFSCWAKSGIDGSCYRIWQNICCLSCYLPDAFLYTNA